MWLASKTHCHIHRHNRPMRLVSGLKCCPLTPASYLPNELIREVDSPRKRVHSCRVAFSAAEDFKGPSGRGARQKSHKGRVCRPLHLQISLSSPFELPPRVIPQPSAFHAAAPFSASEQLLSLTCARPAVYVCVLAHSGPTVDLILSQNQEQISVIDGWVPGEFPAIGRDDVRFCPTGGKKIIKSISKPAQEGSGCLVSPPTVIKSPFKDVQYGLPKHNQPVCPPSVNAKLH